ncbi:MAG: prepilin peptidase [Georgenia sp.]
MRQQLTSVRTWVVAVLVAAAAGGLLAEGPVPVLLAGVALAVVATFLAAVDLRAHRLPDVLLAGGTAAVTVLLLVAAIDGGAWGALGRAAATAVVSLAVYLVLALLRAGGLGLGDVKLAGLLGLWLGWFGWQHAVAGALGGFILGGVWAIGLLIARRASRTTSIAFGPWMILGAAVATVLAVTDVRY